MERRNIFLIIIIVILVVLIGIAAYYVYQANQMQKVDKLMSDNNNVLGPELASNETEANNLANSSSPNYNKVEENVNSAIDIQTQILDNDELAYDYADGSYKNLMSLGITMDRLNLDSLNNWSNRLEYLKQGEYGQATELLSQDNQLSTQITTAENDYQNFKDTHPDIKEHGIKYWNSTAQ